MGAEGTYASQNTELREAATIRVNGAARHTHTTHTYTHHTHTDTTHPHPTTSWVKTRVLETHSQQLPPGQVVAALAGTGLLLCTLLLTMTFSNHVLLC